MPTEVPKVRISRMDKNESEEKKQYAIEVLRRSNPHLLAFFVRCHGS